LNESDAVILVIGVASLMLAIVELVVKLIELTRK